VHVYMCSLHACNHTFTCMNMHLFIYTLCAKTGGECH